MASILNSPSSPTRRLFLASTLAAPAILRAQDAPARLKVAFIGVGNRGAYLLSQMLKVPGIDIVAVCDLIPERAAKAAAEARAAGHKPAEYVDFRKMLEERKDIEAVVAAVPVDTHLRVALGVLEAGKHIYSEKPMGLSPQECTTTVKAAQSAKGIYQIGFQLRHDPNRAASMAFVKSGGIGKVLYCQGYRHGGDLPYNEPWLFDKKRSGDIIVEQACHILDLMTWAIGKPPLRAMGSGGISLFKDVPPGRTVMDNYSVIYEYPGDVRLNFSQIYFDPAGFSGTKERVYGSEGAIDLAKAQYGKLDQKGPLVQLDVPDAGQAPEVMSLRAFVDNAVNGKKPLNDAESGRISTLVGILGRTAIEQRRIVTWEEVAG
jgi:predicted dehydrogenase